MYKQFYQHTANEITQMRYYKNLRRGGFSRGQDTLIYSETIVLSSDKMLKIEVTPVYPRLDITTKSEHSKSSSIYIYDIPPSTDVKIDKSQPYIKYNARILRNKKELFSIEVLIEVPLEEDSYKCIFRG